MALNAIRFLSIVGLLLVFSSSIFVMVTDVQAFNRFQIGHQTSSLDSTSNSTNIDVDYISGSTVPNQAAGIFWAVLNRLLIIFQVIILLLSEVGWPAIFFETYFPVLGREFGLGALGIFQCLIGAAVLSHHTDNFTLVAAFFLFSIGCVNMLVGLIFRESAKVKRSILRWKSDSKSVLPVDNRPVFASPTPTYVANVFGATHDLEKGYNSDEEYDTWRSGSGKSGYGFGRQGEKAASLKGYFVSKPVESLPRYAPARPPSLSSGSETSSAPSSRPSTPTSSRPVTPVFKSSPTAL